MYALRRILSPPAALAAAVLIFAGCNAEPTRPAIPTISAQTAGTVYCSEWSCAYETCHNRPDWDGGSCCLQHTLDQSEAVDRPAYCAQPKPIGGGGSCGAGTY